MVWSIPDPGFDFEFTAKASHEGTYGGVGYLMDGIAYEN